VAGDSAVRYAPGTTRTNHSVETDGVNLVGEQQCGVTVSVLGRTRVS
jgi:hypothetical protein